jgi:hypothetical protein
MSSRPGDRSTRMLSTYEAVLFVDYIAGMLGIAPPRVASKTPDGIVRSDYSEDSRTIALVGGSAPVEAVLHEFQHYLDDLHGQPLEGALRGTHDGSFYTRLHDLEDFVKARAAERASGPETAAHGPEC